MQNYNNKNILRTGFTMLEITIVLVIAALVLAAFLPFLTDSLQSNQKEITENRIKAVQTAIRNYIPDNGLPCPADPTIAVNEAGFGNAEGSGGTCSGAMNDGDVYGGMVPTKSLGLADDYAFDGWGRRLMYHVDQRLTDFNNFLDFADGSLTIKDQSGADRATDAAYVLLSHGATGHGGYLESGQKLDTGATNTLKQANSGESGYNNEFYQSAMTSQSGGSEKAVFDDIVSYQSLSKLKMEAGFKEDDDPTLDYNWDAGFWSACSETSSTWSAWGSWSVCSTEDDVDWNAWGPWQGCTASPYWGSYGACNANPSWGSYGSCQGASCSCSSSWTGWNWGDGGVDSSATSCASKCGGASSCTKYSSSACSWSRCPSGSTCTGKQWKLTHHWNSVAGGCEWNSFWKDQCRTCSSTSGTQYRSCYGTSGTQYRSCYGTSGTEYRYRTCNKPEGEQSRTRTCTRGTQSRSVVCRNTNGTVVANSYCNASTKPAETQHCTPPCGGESVQTQSCTPVTECSGSDTGSQICTRSCSGSSSRSCTKNCSGSNSRSCTISC